MQTVSLANEPKAILDYEFYNEDWPTTEDPYGNYARLSRQFSVRYTLIAGSSPTGFTVNLYNADGVLVLTPTPQNVPAGNSSFVQFNMPPLATDAEWKFPLQSQVVTSAGVIASTTHVGVIPGLWIHVTDAYNLSGNFSPPSGSIANPSQMRRTTVWNAPQAIPENPLAMYRGFSDATDGFSTWEDVFPLAEGSFYYSDTLVTTDGRVYISDEEPTVKTWFGHMYTDYGLSTFEYWFDNASVGESTSSFARSGW